MSTLDLVAYYVNLLIIQYASKPRAAATIETLITPALIPQVSTQLIAYQSAPASGSFVLSWEDESAAAIDWDDDAATIQTKLQAVTGLSLVTVTGSAAAGFTVTFVGVDYVAPLFVVESSTIDTGAPSVSETDSVLLIAIQDAFNPDTAVGAQLDTIGKYVGVTRTAQGSSGPVTLSDDDFRALIRFAVLTNNAQSDLSSIQDLINTFFPGDMLVFDYANMRMSYLISSALGSTDLVQMVVAQELLPRPMAVQAASVIFAPVITEFFGFCTYEIPVPNGNNPFNTYEDYQTTWPWLVYENGIVI